MIGSIRRECLDHIVAFGKAHLRRILAGYAGYYNEVRTHLDSPRRRQVQRLGQLAALPIPGRASPSILPDVVFGRDRCRRPSARPCPWPTSTVHHGKWQPFAELVLEAAYEATLLATALNAGRGGSNIVMLTRLGGGAFGNEDHWIDGALKRALKIAEGLALDVRMVRRV